jgi:beta-mannosidase
MRTFPTLALHLLSLTFALMALADAAEPGPAPSASVPALAIKILPPEENRLPLQLDQFGPAARTARAVITLDGAAAPTADLHLAGYDGDRQVARYDLAWMGEKPWVARVDLPAGVDAVAVLSGQDQRELKRSPVPRAARSGNPWTSDTRPRALAMVSHEVKLSGSDWKLGSYAMGTGESAKAFQMDCDLSSYRTVAVPGEIPLQMGLSGPDLYYQSRALTFINEREWWYRKSFRTPAEAKGAVARLVFDGVDYYSTIWLNGEKLGEHEGMFSPFTSFDVGGLLRHDGHNVLVVKVTCPWLPADRSLHEYIKGQWTGASGGVMKLSSPAAVIGPFWDGIPAQGNAVFPMGIFRDVKLAFSGELAINDLQLDTQRIDDNGSATLTVSGTVVNYGSVTATAALTWRLDPDNFTGESISLPTQTVLAKSGETKISVQVTAPRPHLWWSWDMGRQDLYRLKADLSVETQRTSAQRTVGIRTMERHTDMTYRLNGRRIFLQGSWYLSDLYLSRQTRRDYEKNLELYRASGLNHLVNFTLVESPDFYDLCDRLGILNMMELPFHQWGPMTVMQDQYARRETFVRESIGQMRQVMLQLRSHPSIIQWTPFAEVLMVRQDAFAKYGYLDLIRAMTKELAPNAIFHPSFCDAGERHFWDYGFGGSYTPHFNATTQFVSEFGAQAMPDLDLFKSMLTPEQLWSDRNTLRPRVLDVPIDVPVWSYLTCKEWPAFGLNVVLRQIATYIDREPRTIQELADDSQLSQAFLYKYAAEAYRRKLHAPINGLRFWYYRDLMPRIGWGIVDFNATPKMSYYWMKRATSFFTVSFAFKDALEAQPAGKALNIPVWVSNVRPQDATVEAAVEVLDLAGHSLWTKQLSATAPGQGAAEIGTVDWTPPAGDQLYVLRVSARDTVGNQTANNRIVVQVGRKTPPLTVKPIPARVSATSALPLLAPTRDLVTPMRVLVVGQSKFAAPLSDWLKSVGVRVDTISEQSVERMAELRNAQALRSSYDALWLTSCDSAWKLLDDEMAGGMAAAIHAGLGFIHTGGEGSFHGGNGRAALLDLRGFADVLPVVMRNRNDVIYEDYADITDVAVSGSHTESWLAQALRTSGVGGFNLVEAKPGADQILTICGHPLLVTGRHGSGRVAAFTGFTPGWAKGKDVQLGSNTPGPIPRSYEDLWMRLLVAVGNDALRDAYARALASRPPVEEPAAPAPVAAVKPATATEPKLLFQQLKELPATQVSLPTSLTLTTSGRRGNGSVTIRNGAGYAHLVRLQVRWDAPDQAAPFLMYGDNFIDLLPQEEMTIPLEFLLPEGSQAASFSGTLVISGSNVSSQTIPITVRRE